MKHFYNQEGRDDVKIGLGAMASSISALHWRSIANEMESVQKPKEAELTGLYSGTLSIDSNSDVTIQSESLKSSDRYIFEVEPKLLYS